MLEKIGLFSDYDEKSRYNGVKLEKTVRYLRFGLAMYHISSIKWPGIYFLGNLFTQCLLETSRSLLEQRV